MIKLVTLFYQAEQSIMLDDYYYNHYLPMLLKIPGVIKIESTRLYTDMKKVYLKENNPTPPYQIVCEMYFKDLGAFEYGFSTTEGEYIANNSIKVAFDLITSMLGETTTITPEEHRRDPTLIRRTYQSIRHSN